MSKIYLTVGPPASGKSTWSENFAQNQLVKGRPVVKLERDEIRGDIGYRENVTPHGDGWKKKHEDQVTAELKQYMVDHLKHGDVDIIVSDTNLSDRAIEGFKHIAENFDAEINYVLFRTPREDLYHYNLNRAGWKRVPDGVIGDMYRRMVETWPKKYASRTKDTPPGTAAYGENVYVGNPLTGEITVDMVVTPFDWIDNYQVKETVVIDIDGTLANRVNRSPYDESRVLNDEVYHDISFMVNMFRSKEFFVVLMSGRHNTCRNDTERWLDLSGIPYDVLYMRPEGDNVKDSVIKTEMFWHMLDEHAYDAQTFLDIWYVLDDRDQMVSQWRRMGLRCLQVQEGNF